MNLKTVFNKLIRFRTSSNFEDNVFFAIQHKKKTYEVVYPFLYGFIAPIFIGIVGIIVFQVGNHIDISIIIGILGIVIFLLILNRISNLWQQVKSF